MANPSLWGAEKLVNTTTTNAQHMSQVAALEGGGHVAVWANFGTGEVHAQIYDAFGAPLGSQLNLTPNILLGHGEPHVAAVPGGGFAVSFYGQINGHPSNSVQTAVFGKSGMPLTGPLMVNDPGAGHVQMVNAITALGDGTYAVAYITGDKSDFSQTLAVQRFNADGSKLGTEISIGVDTGATTQNLRIADVGGGRFAVAWDSQDDMGDRNVYAQIISNAGAKQGSVFPVYEAPDPQTAAAIAGDGSGKFLVTFHDTGNEFGEMSQALAQLYGTNNTPLPTGTNGAAGPAEISEFTQNGNFVSEGSPTLTALHGGGHMAAWVESSGSSRLIIGQLVDGAGNRVGDEFVIKQAPMAMADFYELALTTLADGRVVLSWSDTGGTLGDSSGAAVHSQIIDPRFGVVTGTAASETLVGSFGVVNDTLTSGNGSDTLAGGLGNDTYVLTGTDDLVAERTNEGIDKVVASASHTLGANVENLTLLAGTNATGNGLANAIEGNAGANAIDGLGGADTMIGFAGDDTYIVDDAGDVVVEAVNGGTDTVYAYVDHTLAANVENLFQMAGYLARGNDLANTIGGNDGVNLLDGQAGADTMGGGAGNDDYVVADAGDMAIEGMNAGFDTVHAAFNFTLGANLEGLVLTGAATKGTGNELANLLAGNAAANTLKGGLGNDTIDGGAGKDMLEGGKGSDTYVLGNAKDKVTDSGGADDTISSTSSRKLTDYKGIENLTLVGTGNAKGTGNNSANDLIGNAGKNELKGGGGNDLLAGGLGRDLLWGNAGKDIFDFNAIAEIGKAKGFRDIIRDFDSSDRIDLSSIDANVLTGGDDKFKLLAKEGSKFGGVAGQLIWDKQDKAGTSKDVTLVSGDLDGDKVADFTLELSGLHNLNKGDFIL